MLRLHETLPSALTKDRTTMTTRLPCLLLALLAPVPALAQGLSFDGTVGLGATGTEGTRGVGMVDVTLTVPLSRRIPLTFEAGTYMVVLEGKRPHETYAAFAWDDRFRAGVVRPAYDSVLPSVFERAAPFLAYERIEYARSHATVEAMRATAVPFGVSAQFTQGALRWMVSAHKDDKGGFDAASVAASYQGTGWQIAAAVESVREHGGPDRVDAKLGTRVALGPQAEAGLTLLSPDGNDRDDALAFDMTWTATETLSFMAFGEAVRGGGDDAWGLAGEYRFRPDTSVILAGTDGDAAGAAWHLTLAHRF